MTSTHSPEEKPPFRGQSPGFVGEGGQRLKFEASAAGMRGAAKQDALDGCET